MKLLLSLVLLSTLASCATILNDETQNINLGTTNNSEVKGTIDGIPFSGPGIISVRRTKADKIIMVESKNCAKQTLLSSSVDSKFFINILSGGTFGSTTDYSTEQMWKYQDSVIIPCS